MAQVTTRDRRDADGGGQTLLQQRQNGLVPLEGASKVKLCNNVLHPIQILLVHRLVQAVLLGEVDNFGLVDFQTGGFQLDDVGGEVISRRQLDNNEDQDTDRYQQRDQLKQTLQDVVEQHLASFSPFPHVFRAVDLRRFRAVAGPGQSGWFTRPAVQTGCRLTPACERLTARTGSAPPQSRPSASDN